VSEKTENISFTMAWTILFKIQMLKPLWVLEVVCGRNSDWLFSITLPAVNLQFQESFNYSAHVSSQKLKLCNVNLCYDF